MSRRIALVLALLAPAVAFADAIEPYSGQCPPGLDRCIVDHAEGCAPRRCETSAQCGEGAACQHVHECWAEREVHDGPPGPQRRRIVVGACDAQSRCADADATCQTRRQCEPTDPSPAWDRASQRWTGESHPGSSYLGSSSGAPGSAPRAPDPARSRGCSAIPSAPSPPSPLFAIAALVLARRR